MLMRYEQLRPGWVTSDVWTASTLRLLYPHIADGIAAPPGTGGLCQLLTHAMKHLLRRTKSIHLTR